MTYRTTITATDDDIKKFKKLCDDKGIKYDTEAEYRDAAQNLLNFFGLIYDMAMEDLQRKKRLEKEPAGFEMLGEGRDCPLCKRCIYGEEKLWFDKWGMKCMDCQAALDKKIIPGYVFKDDKNEKHIAASTLSWQEKIYHSTIKKLVRQGKLKPRIIPGSGVQIFLRKENPDLYSIIDAEKASKIQAQSK